ncbi:MAG TPA: enolase C-terminal domain-like protein, partial [Pirellulaceae bacterium]
MIPFRAYRYRLPMRPLRLAGTVHTGREGVLICDVATGSYWGEAAPLPGFSVESMVEVVSQLRAGPPYPAPSLRFASETLERQIVCSVTSHATKPAETSPVQVSINALIADQGPAAIRAAVKLADSPFAAVKLKVGRELGGPDVDRRGDAASAAAIVGAVRRSLRSDQRLRLDANRCWSLDEARELCHQLRMTDCSIEYFEEPVADPSDLETLW